MRNTPGLSVLKAPHVQNGDGCAAHAIHLGEEQAKAARAAGDYNDFIIQVDLAGEAERHTLVDLAEDIPGGHRPGVVYRHLHRNFVPVHVLSAEAQGYHPGHEGVEEGHIEDLEKEVDGYGRKP